MNSKELFLNRIKEKYKNYTENEYLYYEDINYYYQVNRKKPYLYRYIMKRAPINISPWIGERQCNSVRAIENARCMWKDHTTECKTIPKQFLNSK